MGAKYVIDYTIHVIKSLGPVLREPMCIIGTAGQGVPCRSMGVKYAIAAVGDGDRVRFRLGRRYHGTLITDLLSVEFP